MKHKTTAQMRPIVEGYNNYVGNKKSYCQAQGILVHTFDYWRKKLGSPPKSRPAESKATEQGKFVQLEVSPHQAAAEEIGEVIEIYYVNGNRLVLPPTVSLPVLTNLLQITC